MNADRQQALDYLRAPANGHWRWEENGGVLIWNDGTTIAFREEIRQILQRLGPDHLPPFGALVILLATSRGKLPGAKEMLVQATLNMENSLEDECSTALVVPEHFMGVLASARNQLERVRTMPEELMSGIHGKGLLAEAVFEIIATAQGVNGEAVLRGIRESFTDNELNRSEGGDDWAEDFNQMTIVSEGLKRHTTESLKLRLRTGLDAMPGKADLAWPAAQRARRLIEELCRDQEHGLMARVARELMAAVRLPRRLQQLDPLAIGGVADIHNRGPLDRLLVSELAHDDLTLAIRVALNEALYLRREPPRREPTGGLDLLLDSGIRLWGTPRVLAAGVALALVARESVQTEVRAWRARGKTLESVDLLSLAGLKRHLSALEAEAHPGAALSRFVETIAEDGPGRAVLITHHDTLADPEFRRALQEFPEGLSFVATVDRAGRFELHALPLSRRPPLCQADLDVETLLGDSPSRVALLNPNQLNQLPILLQGKFNVFCYPLNGEVEDWIRTEKDEIIAMMKDRRLMKYQNELQGGCVLASQLPEGRAGWIGMDDRVIHLVKQSQRGFCLTLVTVGLADHPMRVVELANGAEMLAAHRYGDVLLVVRRHDVRAYSLADGQHLGHVMSPHPWVHGRYFRGEKSFFFALWDGAEVTFEPVTIPHSLDFNRARLVFDRQGMIGPWLIYDDRELVQTETNVRIHLGFAEHFAELDFTLTRITRDGHRLYVPYVEGSSRHGEGIFYDLKTQALLAAPTNPEDDPAPPGPCWNLHQDLQALGVHDGALMFLDEKTGWHTIGWHPESGSIRIRESLSSQPRRQVRLGQSQPIAPGMPAVRVAEWPEGVRAFFDSNHVLHLKGAGSPSLEVSLLLSDGEVAGFSSDASICGPRFFMDPNSPPAVHKGFNHPEKVFAILRKIFEQL